jgi:hypothetical protein
MPYGIDISHQALLDNAEKIFAAAPIRSLDLNWQSIDGLVARAIADSPWFSNVKSLSINNNRIGIDAGVFTESRHACRLKHLYLAGSALGDAGLQSLIAGPGATRLETLYLINNDITSHGARLLADSPRLINLTNLQLGYNPIGDAGVQAINNSPHLSRRAKVAALDSLGRRNLADRISEAGASGAASNTPPAKWRIPQTETFDGMDPPPGERDKWNRGR